MSFSMYTDEERHNIGCCLHFITEHLVLSGTTDNEGSEADAGTFLRALSIDIYPEQQFTCDEEAMYGFRP